MSYIDADNNHSKMAASVRLTILYIFPSEVVGKLHLSSAAIFVLQQIRVARGAGRVTGPSVVS